MLPPRFRVRHVNYEDGHDTNCTLRPDREKPEQAVLVPKNRNKQILRQLALGYDLRIPYKEKWLAKAGVVLDVLPVSPEFSHLSGYERLYQFFIERTIEQHEFLRNMQRSLALVPCERCGQELSLWEWWEVIEGEDTKVAPIRDYFSTKQAAEHCAAKLNAETESLYRHVLDSQRD